MHPLNRRSKSRKIHLLPNWLKNCAPKYFRLKKVVYLEDCLFLLGCGPLQLLLDKPWAMLVLAELNNMVGQLTQLQVRVPAVPKIRCILKGRLNYLSCCILKIWGGGLLPKPLYVHMFDNFDSKTAQHKKKDEVSHWILRRQFCYQR